MPRAHNISSDSIVTSALASLVPLKPQDISNLEDACPICLLTFKSILEGFGSGLAGESSSTDLTKIEACGHIFCVEDLSEWIRGRHGTCPACRHPFLPDLKPVDSDDESSDGGEYIPAEPDYDIETDYETDYDDDDNAFGSDGLDHDTMDLELSQTRISDLPGRSSGDDSDGEEISPRVAAYIRRMRDAIALDDADDADDWMDGITVDDERDWGLTDGDSMSLSEGEISPGEHHYGIDSNIQVRLGSDGHYAIDETVPDAEIEAESKSPHDQPTS